MQASTNLWAPKQSTKTLNTPSKTLHVNNHSNVQLNQPHLVSEYSRVDFADNPNKYSAVDSFYKGIPYVHSFDGAYWRKYHFTTCKCRSARKSFNKTVAINLQGGNRKFFKTFKRIYSAPEKEQAPVPKLIGSTKQDMLTLLPPSSSPHTPLSFSPHIPTPTFTKKRKSTS